MKRIHNVFLYTLVLIICVSFLCVQPSQAEGRTIKVGYMDYRGFIEQTSPGQFGGYGVDYLNEIAKYKNWNYEFVSDTWQSLLNRLEEGDIDLIIQAQKTNERLKRFNYSDYPIGNEYTMIYCRSDDDIYYQDYEGMKDKTIGFIKQSYQNEVWVDYAKEHHINYQSKEYESEATLKEGLRRKQVDMMVIGSLGLQSDVKILDRVDAVPYYAITSKKDNALSKEINDTLELINKNNPYFASTLENIYYQENAYTTQPLFTREDKEYIDSMNDKVYICTDERDVPFVFTQNGERVGIYKGILDLMSQKSGIEFEFDLDYQSKNETGFSEYMDTHPYTLFCGITRSNSLVKDHKEYWVSDTFLSLDQVIVKNKDDDLKGEIKIAVTKDHDIINSPLYNQYKQATVEYYDTLKDCLDALKYGKASITINNAYSVNYLMQNEVYEKQLNIYNSTFKNTDLCFIGSSSLDDHFQLIMNKLIASLTINELENTTYQQMLGLSYQYTFVEFISNNFLYLILTILIIGIIIYGVICTNKKHTQFVIASKETQLLRQRAEIDAVSGIYNKDTFYEKAQVYIQQAHIPYDMMVIDINRFKVVNDLFGMSEGDRLLKHVGNHLKKYMVSHPEVIAGRLEADSFALLIPRNQVEGFKMLDMLDDYHLDFNITLRYGIYPILEKTVPINIMCDRAQLAANSIRDSYVQNLGVYNDDLREQILIEQEIMNEIQGAMDNGDIVIYIQPKYDIVDRLIVGGEALVRWIHPTKGLIPPSDFIPILEKNGYITHLDYYVWNKTCHYISELKKQGIKTFPISINVSRLNFYSGNLIEELNTLIRYYDLSPDDIQLEITESVYVIDKELIYTTLIELQQVGFKILMDDFGTGYSSLNMLKDAPIDILKLDMGFIDERESHQKRSEKIVEAIITLAHSLEIPVIVEGVETLYQVEFLKSINARIIQGYYFSKPLPEEQFTELVKALENR